MARDTIVINKTGAVVTNSYFSETLIGRVDGDLIRLVYLTLKTTLWGKNYFHLDFTND